MSILNYIPVGKDDAVTREQLCALTGMSDRGVRKLIELARIEGAMIVNDQDGRGYYISDNEEDIRRQMATNHSRAMSILRQQKLLRRKLEELRGADQITIEEVGR